MTEQSAASSLHYLTPAQQARIARLDDTDPHNVNKKLSFRPTDVYVSQERFNLEINKLFRGRPVPITVSGALPHPKSHVVIRDYKVPVLLTRDAQGVVRAFVNVCTHRAVELCQAREVSGGSLITCPYHAWSFGLDGALVALPRAEVFPGLDKSKLGLIEFESAEAGGLIWVNLDHKAKADFSLIKGTLADELSAIALPEQKLWKHARFELNSNWKLTHDAFLENYHIARLHSNSLGRMFTDRTTVCEQIGPHICHMSGRVGFKAGERSTFEAFREFGVFCYTLLPGAIIITSQDYISVMLLSPQATDRTVINYYLLVDKLPETEAETAHYERSLKLMLRITTEEDFWAAELGTIGAATGAVQQMVLGGMEQEIVRFHEIIEAELNK